MIDHLSSPPIVDLVFASAPPESLAVLARVSRGWRQRALSETSLVYNLLDDMYLSPSPIIFEEAARHCRVLDVAVGNPATDNHLIPEVARLQTFAPDLVTIRLRRAAYADKAMWLPSTPRIVFGAFHPDHTSLKGLERGMRNGEWKTMEKLVIIHHQLVWTCCKHKRAKDDDGGHSANGEEGSSDRGGQETIKDYATLFPQLKQVVLILRDDSACPSCIRSLLNEAQAVSVPVTIVGVPPSQSFQVRGSTVIQLTKYGGRLREGVEVLTHRECCRRVDEREYAIEADWEQTPLLRPLDVSNHYFPPLRNQTCARVSGFGGCQTFSDDSLVNWDR